MTQTQSIHKGINSDQLSIANTMREVNTAKMQANAGAVNAGLSEEERAAKAPSGQAINFNWDNISLKTIDGRGRSVQDDYSQKCSGLSPYDDDIGVKNLKNWKTEAQTGLKPGQARACKWTLAHVKQRFQGKRNECQRHMVIVDYEKYSTTWSGAI